MKIRMRYTTLFLSLALVAQLMVMAGPASARARGLGSPEPAARAQRAAEPEREQAPPPVEVGFSGSMLVIEPRVSGVATSVYVSCADGTYIHRELEGVGPVLVELVREDGAPVADGRCKYEVYVHPPVDGEAMRAAEEAGDFATIERLSRIEQEQTVISHGHFRVAGGVPLASTQQGTNS